MTRILIVIDMQNDFIDGSLGTKEAQAIVPAVKEKIRSYPKEDVLATMDTHFPDYMETQEGKNLPVMHCVKGTDGWQIRPELAELILPENIYEKPRSDAWTWRGICRGIAKEERTSNWNWLACARISASFRTHCC